MEARKQGATKILQHFSTLHCYIELITDVTRATMSPGGTLLHRNTGAQKIRRKFLRSGDGAKRGVAPVLLVPVIPDSLALCEEIWGKEA